MHLERCNRPAARRPDHISTVHWVHLEPPAAPRHRAGACHFNRPLGASGTGSIRSVQLSQTHFNRPLGASGTRSASSSLTRWMNFNRPLGASGTREDAAGQQCGAGISTVHWVHLEPVGRAYRPSRQRHFNRPLGASGTHGIRARCSDTSYFNRPLGASGTRHSRRAVRRYPISTVHWVHLEPGSIKANERSKGPFQPSIGCIWNPNRESSRTTTISFQPSIGCIWNNVVRSRHGTSSLGSHE